MTKGRKRRHESGTPEKGGEEGLTHAVTELKSFIKTKTEDAVAEITKKFDQRITGFEESLNFAYESITVTSNKVNAAEKEIKKLNADLETVSYRLALLEQEKEEAERNSRLSVLIFSGQDLHLPDSSDRLGSVIAAVIDRLLELEVRAEQVLSTKRLPRNRVLVKFTCSGKGSLRDLVFRAKGKLRGHKIFINESLTPTRQEAFNILLHHRRQGRIRTVVTHGGEVLFAFNRGERLIRVKNKSEVEMALQELPDSGPVLPDRSAAPSPGPGGAEPAAVAAPGTGEGPAAVEAAARRPADDGGTTPAEQDTPSRHRQLQSPLTGPAGSGPPAIRRDDTEVGRGRPGSTAPESEDDRTLGLRLAERSDGSAPPMVRPSGPDTSVGLSRGHAGPGQTESGGPVAARGSPNSASHELAKTESGRTARGEGRGARRGGRPSSVPGRGSGGAGAPVPVRTGHLPSTGGTAGFSDPRGSARPARGPWGPRSAKSGSAADAGGSQERDIRSYWS